MPTVRAILAAGSISGFACSLPALAGGVAPFTSEHSARGVVYNMMFSPPITNPQDGFGMACADLDGDGDLDLVLLGRADGLVGLYENGGAGSFTNRSATSGIPSTPSGCGVCAFDYDRDGDLDIFIAQKNAPARLLRNNGSLQFNDVAAAAGVGRAAPATGCSVADFDADGWPDLYLCTYQQGSPNRLYRNRGDGTFEDVAAALGVASTGLSYQSVWSDYDRDTWPDLCVSNDRGFGNVPNQLWRNSGGSFTDVSSSSGMNVALCSMGVACADLDGDQRSDFYFTNLPDPAPPLLGVNPLMISSAAGTFSQQDAAWGVSHLKMSWAAIFWDFDNDADIDLYVNNETQPNTLYRNAGAPPMTDIAASALVTGTAPLSYVSVTGDLDGDGDLDLVQNNYAGAVRLYMNNEGSQRAWLRLRVAGEGRVRDAIGASATLAATGDKGAALPLQWREVLCGGNGYLGQNETTLHFGLGTASAVDSIVVRWPAGGPVRTLTNVPIRAAWTAYPPSRLGDVDADGTIGLSDWTRFAQWGLGTVVAGREMLDFDGDFDIDASDLSAFWAATTLRRGDLDGDGTVAANDLASLLSSWGQSGVPADLDLDGSVGAADLAVMLSSWGS
jgi:enediyne biosynthesis protein E4